jgi:hypothetical protein
VAPAPPSHLSAVRQRKEGRRKAPYAARARNELVRWRRITIDPAKLDRVTMSDVPRRDEHLTCDPITESRSIHAVVTPNSLPLMVFRRQAQPLESRRCATCV